MAAFRRGVGFGEMRAVEVSDILAPVALLGVIGVAQRRRGFGEPFSIPPQMILKKGDP
jgi:hypothetical protein